MAEITFFLRAERKADGHPRVMEWYRWQNEVNGVKTVLESYVDDDIRHEHKKEYQKFKADVEANEDRLYAEATAELEAKEREL